MTQGQYEHFFLKNDDSESESDSEEEEEEEEDYVEVPYKAVPEKDQKYADQGWMSEMLWYDSDKEKWNYVAFNTSSIFALNMCSWTDHEEYESDSDSDSE